MNDGEKNTQNEERLDKIISLAFIQQLIEDMDELDKELDIENYKYEFSERYQKRKKKIIRKYQRKLDRGRFYKSPPGKVAIFVALFILISAAISVSTIAIRIIFYSPEVIEVNEEEGYFSTTPKRLTPDEIILNQEMDRIASIIKEHSNFSPWFNQIQGGSIKNNMKNDNDYINLTISLDEEAQDEPVTIDGDKYTWVYDGFKYIVETNINEDEILEIIQKLKRN